MVLELFKNNNFKVLAAKFNCWNKIQPGNCYTSEYRYSEVEECPINNTWKCSIYE